MHIACHGDDNMIFVCSSCGSVCQGLKSVGLSEDCKGRYTSQHNRSNWNRMFQRKHPNPSKGEAKVLDELLPLSNIV